ncbi:MAG: hypothetical protein LWW93_07600 [Hyphomicrobiales bacterium]|nr:hypothetical protein [Hyphomicrobiales bacterium]
MTMSISHPLVRPPTLEAAAPRTEAPSSAPASRTHPTAAGKTAASEHPRATDIGFDDRSGFMVVRTVDVVTGEVVAQNPTEAYLRLAQAMTATVRADAEQTSSIVA